MPSRHIAALLVLFTASSIWPIRGLEVGAGEKTTSSPDAWSKPVDVIRARLRIEYVEDSPVHLEHIGAVPVTGHIPTVEFKNTSGRTLSVCNRFHVEAKLTGSDGKEIKKGSRIQHVSGAFIGPEWAAVPKGAYVGWPADSRSHSFLPVYRFKNGDGFAFLAIGHSHWKLKPGRYSVESKLIANAPSMTGKPLKMPDNHWTGEISLPTTVFVVTDEQVVAKDQKPDAFEADDDRVLGLVEQLKHRNFARRQQAAGTRDRVTWVAKCLKDFQAIKVGMTRQHVEKRFHLDGGLQGVSPVRFTHPECPYFKIDVEFSFKRNPQDQNRAITSPDDRATKVSKPYFETPYLD